MKYITNEGVLEIPKTWINQTIHVLTEKLGKPGLTLIITKENVEKGIDITSFANSQFKKLEQELSALEWLGKEQARIGGKAGIMVEYRWAAEQGQMHILQAIVIKDDKAVFITLNSLEAFFKSLEHERLFREIVGSYSFI